MAAADVSIPPTEASKEAIPHLPLFTSQTKEIVENNLPITGQFPSWVHGTVFRNGPGLFEVGHDNIRHWFDGYSLLHSFSVQNGAVSYRCKFLGSKAYTEAIKQQRVVYHEFSTDPCLFIFKRMISFFTQVTDNSLVNVAKIGEKFAALTETTCLVTFNPDTLEAIEHISLFDIANGKRGTPTTAHPFIDPDTGDYFNVIGVFGWDYVMYKWDAKTSERSVVARWKSDMGTYCHSFATTSQYFVMTEQSAYWSLKRLLTKPMRYNCSIRDCIVWDPSIGTRFVIIDRKSGQMLKRRAIKDAFFVFHHVNAWEEDDAIVVDMVVYDDMKIVDTLYLSELRVAHPSVLGIKAWLRRYRIPLDETKEITHEDLCNGEFIELPRINEKYATKKHRFVYGSGSVPERAGQWWHAIVKLDTQENTVKRWHAEGCYAGEPIFVPNPNGSGQEDDGVLLCVCFNSTTNTSFLVSLDAQSMTELGRAVLPVTVPAGFHGIYVDK